MNSQMDTFAGLGKYFMNLCLIYYITNAWPSISKEEYKESFPGTL